jgi:hypothetical protein
VIREGSSPFSRTKRPSNSWAFFCSRKSWAVLRASRSLRCSSPPRGKGTAIARLFLLEKVLGSPSRFALSPLLKSSARLHWRSVRASIGNRVGRKRTTGGAALSLLISISHANAADTPRAEQPAAAPVPIELEWHSAPSCPEVTAAAFRAQVGRFSEHVVWLEAGAQRRVLVRLDPGGSSGFFALFEPPLDPTRRDVAGLADCAALTRALAFALAVALDPEASMPTEEAATTDSGREEVPAPAPNVDAAPSTLVETPEPLTSVAVAPAPVPAPTLARNSSVASPQTMVTSPAATSSTNLRVAVYGQLGVGIGDAPSFGGGAGLGLRSGARHSRASQVVSFAPELTLSARYERGHAQQGSIRVASDLVAAEVHGCPLAFGGPDATLMPCLGLNVGSLRVHAEGLTQSTPQQAFWTAVTSDLGFVVPLGTARARFALGAEWHVTQPYFQILRVPEDTSAVRVFQIGLVSGFARLTLFFPLSRSEG